MCVCVCVCVEGVGWGRKDGAGGATGDHRGVGVGVTAAVIGERRGVGWGMGGWGEMIVAFYCALLNIHRCGACTALFGCYMAGAKSN